MANPNAEGCTPPPTTRLFTQSASVGGSVDFCVADTSNVVVQYSGSGSGTSGISDADATYIANMKANAAAAADLTAKTPSGATKGACGPVTDTAAATTVPQAGTVVVTKPKPAKVSKPAKAHVPTTVDAGVVNVPQAAQMPSAVDAGGGSSAPTTPVLGWVLLAIGMIGAAAATSTMVAAREK